MEAAARRGSVATYAMEAIFILIAVFYVIGAASLLTGAIRSHTQIRADVPSVLPSSR